MLAAILVLTAEDRGPKALRRPAGNGDDSPIRRRLAKALLVRIVRTRNVPVPRSIGAKPGVPTIIGPTPWHARRQGRSPVNRWYAADVAISNHNGLPGPLRCRYPICAPYE